MFYSPLMGVVYPIHSCKIKKKSNMPNLLLPLLWTRILVMLVFLFLFPFFIIFVTLIQTV